jgi:hypothetical protein
MHGIIFASLYDYARATVGGDATSAIFDRGFYSMSQAHPDEELSALLEKLAAKRDVDVDALLRDFGAFTAEQTFARLYPAFFEIAGDTRSFLLTVEDRIHELVRSTIPHAQPPALTVRPLGDDGVEIDYASPRRLCRLLEGLVAGTAARFAQTVAVEEVECMRDGAQACRFEVRIGVA